VVQYNLLLTCQTETTDQKATELTKIYGSGNTEVVALRDASLCVERGEVVALVGPSGAGKSALLTTLGLTNPPTAGRVAIGGVPVIAATAR
jgi:putative ABC transport system ATP-binding protein